MTQKSLEIEKKVFSKVQYEPLHMQICLRNNIKIYYAPIDNFNGKIIIEDNGNNKVGNKLYKNQNVKHGKNEVGWWKVVEKLYTQEYLKLPEGLKEIYKIEVELEMYLKLNKNKYEKQKG